MDTSVITRNMKHLVEHFGGPGTPVLASEPCPTLGCDLGLQGSVQPHPTARHPAPGPALPLRLAVPHSSWSPEVSPKTMLSW